MTLHPLPKFAVFVSCLLTAGLVAAFAAAPARADLGDQLFKLIPTDAAADDNFGYSVAINGNVAIVGAPLDNDAGFDNGSAYLFDLTTGDELFKLTASDAADDDFFGFSLAISGNIAIIGAPGDEDAGVQSGSAYLFDITTGNELAKLAASDAAPAHFFGWSVGISGNTAIVAAVGDDAYSGAAYLFDVTTGDELFKLTASDAAPAHFFGWSVGISGNTAIVGAAFGDSAVVDTGSAYLFDVTTGDEIEKLTAADAAEGEFFGWAVAISGDTAIVGSPVDAVTGEGSAFVFDLVAGNELAKLTASDAPTGAAFGAALAISDRAAVIGAYLDDIVGSDSGSAYIFSVIPEPPSLLLLSTAAAWLSLFVAQHRRPASPSRRNSAVVERGIDGHRRAPCRRQ